MVRLIENVYVFKSTKKLILHKLTFFFAFPSVKGMTQVRGTSSQMPHSDIVVPETQIMHMIPLLRVDVTRIRLMDAVAAVLFGDS